jgi:serine/threonine protein kinase
METPCGSPFYAAPELILGHQYDGTKTDIWSAGVVLFGLATGAVPWTAENQTVLTHQITTREFTIPQFVTPDVRDCIDACLQLDPLVRPSAFDLLQMDLLRDMGCEHGMRPNKKGIRMTMSFTGSKTTSMGPVRRVITKPIVRKSIVCRTPPPMALKPILKI